jgi:type I restriction enzyme S subunit
LRERKLPEGWEWKRLGEITTVSAGNGAPQGDEFFVDGKFPFVRTFDVGKKKANYNLMRVRDYINEQAIKKNRLQLFPAKTLLIPKSGASTFLNHRALLGIPAYVSSHLATVSANENVLPEFLFYWSLLLDARTITHDVNYPSLKLSEIESAQIPLPPIPVQRQIVAILEQADALMRQRELTDALTGSLLKSIFYQMFGNPVTNEKRWEILRLEKICKKITDGTHVTPNYIEHGVPFLSVKNLTKGFLDFSDTRFISPEAHNQLTQRCKPERGDVLLTKVGVNYGIAEIIDVDTEFSIFVSLALLKPDFELVDPHYLKYCINSEFVYRQAQERISGIGVPDLHLVEIKQFKIPLPPLVLQQQFANIVEQV